MMLWTFWARPLPCTSGAACRPLASWPQTETRARENAPGRTATTVSATHATAERRCAARWRGRGYSSASLRERIYLGSPVTPAAGVLISTAASDSEGTLGGLVALGHRRHLGRLLGLALEEAEHCSSDPLCAEHLPTPQHATLHAAACHACLFASETSCESGNRRLVRAVLGDLTGDGLAFTR